MAKRRPAIVFYCCFLLVGLARAQPRPTQPQGSSQGQRLPQGERPLSLSGRVLYQDGSPAEVAARVELICDGQVRRQAHTLDGHFHLVVDGSNIHGAAMDASVASQDALGGVNSSRTAGLGLGTTGQTSQGGQFLGTSGPGHADLSGCELRASQVGFLANKGSFDAAARELKHFLKLKPEGPEGERVREYLDEWEKKGLIKVAGGQ